MAKDCVERSSLAARWHHRLTPQDDDHVVLVVCADPDHFGVARATARDDQHDRSGAPALCLEGALLDIADVLSAARAEDANLDCCMRVVANKST